MLSMCPSCVFGTSPQRPWRLKGKDRKVFESPTNNSPEKNVAMDQMTPRQPGLMPQHSGTMSASCAWDAKMLVDFFTDYTFTRLMRSTTQEETLKVKAVFEQKMRQFEVLV